MKTAPPGFSRRNFLLLATGAVTSRVTAQECLTREPPAAVAGGTQWHDVRNWGVEGKGWRETEHYYDRLPVYAKPKVRDIVWKLSRHSAGMLVRFRTDATEIHAKIKLISPCLDMPFMPAEGASGLDLYARDKDRDYWLSTGYPFSREMNIPLVSGIDPPADGKTRLYTLYLPLYNGIESLQIGVPESSVFTSVPPRTLPPVVFYGTSIIHGASASRPGMSISSILGRRLERPVINLGFASNGRMEKALGDLLCELDPCVYVIDCLPNMQADEVSQRCGPLVGQLRRARRRTPILLVEDRTITNARFRKQVRQKQAANRAALKSVYASLKDEGITGLHYIEGELLMGDDGEASVDGSHPTDLGMVRYADVYEKILRDIIRE